MPSRPRPRDPDVYPQVLQDAEDGLIEKRRSAIPRSETVAPPASPPPLVGVGLSGGGIRSATFCLGVFQAMARAKLVRRIDFLSTVSGGGYFGSFLGRLFTRDWIHGVDDVEGVLGGIGPAVGPTGWADRTFRWLRENSRYLAPRGSGDILVFGAVLLRNWIAVQLVLVVSVMTLFVGLQLIRPALEYLLGLTHDGSRVGYLLACVLPGQSVWWSPWVLMPLVPFLTVAVPSGWAYWMVVPKSSRRGDVPPWVGLVLVTVLGLAGALYYRPGWLSYLPYAAGDHAWRWTTSVLVFATGTLTLLAWWLARRLTTVDAAAGSTGMAEVRSRLRSRLTGWTSSGLILTGIVLAWALLDTAGGTLYRVVSTDESAGRTLAHWAALLFSGFASIGAFARQIALFLAPAQDETRPRVSMSILTWGAAVICLALWLVTVNFGSQAIAWHFKPPRRVPVVAGAPPTILGADHLVVSPSAGEFVVRAAGADVAACAVNGVERYSWPFPVVAFGVLSVFTFFFGRTLSFSNNSSIHAFYGARLTRAYLGASNPTRLEKDTPVTDTIPEDDYAGDAYWNWPRLPNSPAPTGPLPARPHDKGGPLHIVNATINETVDAKTGVQNQDRKGTGIALGPAGLSVGIRHHLVAGGPGGVTSVPAEGSGRRSVFGTAAPATTPEPLSLGRWMSVSGAAFSAAAGANTTVPIAILAGLFNVRLGYWWDSGTVSRGWAPDRLLPVQAALFSEMFAQTRGTAGRFWNLSDGGHFENMGGYELIRRRLPLVVIIDAEADPDYTFAGLSDLIRKARLDFNAEITFLNDAELSGTTTKDGVSTPLLPANARSYFGTLDALRRGDWTDGVQPFPKSKEKKRFSIDVDRSRLSCAHAALARVDFEDPTYSAWLVYVKTTLIGDEPEDVAQYHRAHPDFPQETTTDQFFDERQWESYRRLGLHVGSQVLTSELMDYLSDHPAGSFTFQRTKP